MPLKFNTSIKQSVVVDPDIGNGCLAEAFFLLRSYQNTGNEEHLALAVVLAKGDWSSRSRRLQLSDHNGLVNGIAGTLLFYISLQKEIAEDWLEDCIRHTVLVLLGKSQLLSAGIFWKQAGSQASEWAYGNAGIALSLFEAADHFEDETLYAIARSALYFREPSADMAPGCPGSSLVLLYCSRYTGDISSLEHWEKLADSAELLLDKGELFVCPTAILQGLTGWGLAFRDAAKITGRDRFLKIAHAISAIGAADDNSTLPSILLPGVSFERKEVSADGARPHGMLPRRIINQRIAAASLEHALIYLDREFRAGLDEFLAGQPLVSSTVFFEWAGQLRETVTDPIGGKAFGAMMDKQLFISGVREKLPDMVPDDDLLFAENMDRILKGSLDDFLRLKLGISEKVFLFRVEETIDFTRPVDPAVFSGLSSYGVKSSFFRINSYYQLEEGTLGITRLFADLFIQPAHVGVIFELLVSFVKNMDTHSAALVAGELKATDASDLGVKVEESIVNAIKSLLISGVLEVL
jgi:hypothetical protein